MFLQEAFGYMHETLVCADGSDGANRVIVPLSGCTLFQPRSRLNEITASAGLGMDSRPTHDLI